MSNRNAEKYSGELSSYLATIKKIPVLSVDEEKALGQAWKRDGDEKALDKLCHAHLKLAVKMAMNFRNYHVPVDDLINEANLGLVLGSKKFDPDRGFRFSTFVRWWIKAQLFECVTKTWSIVRMPLSSDAKTLFFNIQKTKDSMGILTDGFLNDADAQKIADHFGVPCSLVVAMDTFRSSGYVSLNTVSDFGVEAQTMLPDANDLADVRIEQRESQENAKKIIRDGIDTLSERERDIIIKRQLTNPVVTLSELADEMGVSRERVRQIQERAMDKLRKNIKESADETLASCGL